MIDKKTFYNNLDEDDTPQLGMFAISFDEIKKKEILKTRHLPLENNISNKEEVSKKISKILYSKIDCSFQIETYRKKWRLYPKWIKNEYPETKKINIFLSKSSFFPMFIKSLLLKSNNFEEFFNLFLDYPMKYNYQDIYLFSIEKPLIISISHHGSFWIISNNLNYLTEIFNLFNKSFDIIIKDKTFDSFYRKSAKTST